MSKKSACTKDNSINLEQNSTHEIQKENTELRTKMRNLYLEMNKMKLEMKRLEKFEHIYKIRLEYLRLKSGDITHEKAIEIDLEKWFIERDFVWEQHFDMERNIQGDLEIITVNDWKFSDL